MNKVIISGNLTKDMDVVVTKNDVNIGKFTVAVNNGYGENTNTQFYPVILFGKRVEALQKYLLKGSKVIIEGQIDYNSIQDDEGNWKNYFQLIANDIDIVKFVEVQEENLEIAGVGFWDIFCDDGSIPDLILTYQSFLKVCNQVSRVDLIPQTALLY